MSVRRRGTVIDLPAHYNPAARERPHHIKKNSNDHRVVAPGITMMHRALCG